MTDRGALERIRSAGVVAIIRASGPERVAAAGVALEHGGVRCMEVSLTTPGALDAVSALRERLGPDCLVGAGTVTTLGEADEALRAGAAFLISPVLDPELLQWSVERGVLAIPGALTPTEISSARRAGAAAVKVFPVGAVGGADYIRAIRAPMPDAELIPNGGVRLDDVPAHLAAGAAAVGVGAPLLSDALAHGGDLDALSARAETLVAAVRAVRETTVA